MVLKRVSKYERTLGSRCLSIAALILSNPGNVFLRLWRVE